MWRFLEKEKPSDGEKVLIAMDEKVEYGTIKDYEVATFDGGRFFDSYGEFVSKVTHWQRIEPPEAI